jgi:hypothetical protein
MPTKKSRKTRDTGNARKLTPDEIKSIRDLNWSDIDKELREARDEAGEKEPTEEDIRDFEEGLAQQLPDYQNYVSNRAKDLGYGPSVKEPKKTISIKNNSITLQNSLKDFNPEILVDPYLYMPDELRFYVTYHDFMIDLMANYLTDYIMQPSRNKYEKLEFVVEYANSCGLAFRKMYCVNGSYAAVFFTFTDRTNDTMIEDYRISGHMMFHEESVVIKKKIKEIKRLDDANAPEETYESKDEANEKEGVISLPQKDILINMEQTKDYICSTCGILIFYHIDKNSLVSVIKEETAMILRWDKHKNILCKFHSLLVLPNL